MGDYLNLRDFAHNRLELPVQWNDRTFELQNTLHGPLVQADPEDASGDEDDSKKYEVRLSSGITWNPDLTRKKCEGLYGTSRSDEVKLKVDRCVQADIADIAAQKRQAGFEAQHAWTAYRQKKEEERHAEMAKDRTKKLDILEELSKSDAEKRVFEEFYDFNIAAVKELQEQGIFTREKNTLEIVAYYCVYVVAWGVLLVPGTYDIVLFVLYALNDFGAAFEQQLDDYLSGWTIWAIGQMVVSVVTIGLYITGLVLQIVELVDQGRTYTSAVSIVTEPWWFWTMISLNILNITLTASKVILIFIEVNAADADVINVFKMSEKVGTMNLDLELWPDVAKMCVMVANFGFVLSLSVLADGIVS